MGKSTQARLLAQRLGADVVTFPGAIFLGVVWRHDGSPFFLNPCPSFTDRTTPIGKAIDAFLKNAVEVDDRAIYVLFFSSNRWEAVCVFSSLFFSSRVHFLTLQREREKKDRAWSRRLNWARR